MAKTLQDAVALGRRDSFLVVVATVRLDGSVQSSVVNAGVLAHPTTGADVVGFVTYGPTKLRNLRARPRLAVTFRAAWTWVTVEGRAQLIGPEDPDPSIDAERLRLLLREVYTAAGGQHDDWAAYDRTMIEERRTAVFVVPDRIYGV
ncbi:MAG TPA: TIGR03618 family F420-dependent PPOX class oxidoreductase [Mycobacteriales bacterium]|jgi:PPOX class probable F420-dependent enzyme|nr:TIGR03618 family F420-dependent PPOX class oxidoreductase [Mycobacteriales bacterium]